jgi:hypothetical protein
LVQCQYVARFCGWLRANVKVGGFQSCVCVTWLASPSPTLLVDHLLASLKTLTDMASEKKSVMTVAAGPYTLLQQQALSQTHHHAVVRCEQQQ